MSRMGEKVAWNHEGVDSCTSPWESEMEIRPLCCWRLLRKKALVRRRISISCENQINIVRVIDAHKIGTWVFIFGVSKVLCMIMLTQRWFHRVKCSTLCRWGNRGLQRLSFILGIQLERGRAGIWNQGESQGFSEEEEAAPSIWLRRLKQIVWTS